MTTRRRKPVRTYQVFIRDKTAPSGRPLVLLAKVRASSANMAERKVHEHNKTLLLSQLVAARTW